MPARSRELGVACILFAVAAVALTWPVAASLGRAVPIDPGDPLFTSWLMAWGPEGLFFRTADLFHAPIFHPDPLALAFTENLLGLSIPLSPLWFAAGNPAASGGVALLVSFALNGFSAYVAARGLGASRTGGYVAGLVYAFAPYRLAQISHLHVEATFYIPLLVLAMFRLAERPSWRRGLLVGGLLAAQFWTSLNGGAVAALALGLLLPAMVWRTERGRRLRALGHLTIGGAAALVLVLPLLLPFQRARSTYGIQVQESELALYSADIQSFAIVPPWHRVLGEATAGLRPLDTWSEKALYPGMVAALLAAIGALRLRKRPGMLAGPFLLGAGSIVIAFGPSTAAGLRLPWGWAIDAAPFLTNLRVPSRAWILGLLALGWLAAFAFPLPRLYSAAVLALLVLDYIAVPVPTVEVPRVSPEYRLVASLDGAILELPALAVSRGFLFDPATINYETAAMYRQTAHWRPLANGYSSHLPAGYLALMREVSSFPDAASLEALRSRGVRWVVIHPTEVAGTRWEGVQGRLGDLPVRLRDRDLIVVEVPRR